MKKRICIEKIQAKEAQNQAKENDAEGLRIIQESDTFASLL